VAFFYANERLKVGTEKSNADIGEIARQYDRPVYVYDLDDVEERFKLYSQAFGDLKHTIHYAMKANSHPLLLSKLAQLGAGADTVSIGEVRRALNAGIPGDKIIFSGVAKTKSEIEEALSKDIKQINVESPQELERIAEIAKRLGKIANVAFRLNPDVNPKTHPYITTGFRENKFGMDDSFLPELVSILKKNEKHVRVRGLTLHIGSLLFDLAVFQEAIEKTAVVYRKLEAEGFKLDRFDVGGGLGIHYETDDVSPELDLVAKYGVMLRETLKKCLPNLASTEILAEPGRILVARSGILVSEVQYVKKAPAKTFAILNTGMHHLLRPALYQAKHRILPVHRSKSQANQTYDVVGPICESSDVLGRNIELPVLSPGDYLCIADAGAYGFSMASQYNSHELPKEVFVSQGKPAGI
jgi:diaminopimelate decarboxylase